MEDLPLLRFGLLLVLLLGSAFFAGCDIAFFALSAAKTHRLKETRGRRGEKVAALLENPHRLLVTIYVGNELINVAISAIATFIALDLFGDVGVALFLGFGAYVLIVAGEITPKAYAHNNSEKWALMAAYPLAGFMWLVYPVQAVITSVSSAIAMIFGGPADAENTMLTEEELKTLMEESAGEGILGEEEKDMIQNVFELADVSVEEIMTPRTEILALEVNTPLQEAWDRMAGEYFARAPVYEGEIDNIVGALFKKDLLKLDYPPPPETTLRDLLREPYIVPETKTIKELLNEFRRRKIHMAVVMDEYGGVQGVATLDDILEELIGESRNAQRTNGEEIMRLGAGAFRVMANMELDEFNSFFGVNLAHEEIETVGGYVFHLFGRAPKWGETVEADGLSFTVEKVRKHRIIELRVRRTGPQDESQANGEEG